MESRGQAIPAGSLAGDGGGPDGAGLDGFRYHLLSAKKNGITREEIAEIVTHAAFYCGWPKAWAVFRMAKGIWTEEDAK